jgi:uncharacterized membrane protein
MRSRISSRPLMHRLILMMLTMSVAVALPGVAQARGVGGGHGGGAHVGGGSHSGRLGTGGGVHGGGFHGGFRAGGLPTTNGVGSNPRGCVSALRHVTC